MTRAVRNKPPFPRRTDVLNVNLHASLVELVANSFRNHPDKIQQRPHENVALQTVPQINVEKAEKTRKRLVDRRCPIL